MITFQTIQLGTIAQSLWTNLLLKNQNSSNLRFPKVRKTKQFSLYTLNFSILLEFELVQSAFFTEPDDQSAWLYHRWLLSKVSPLISAPSNYHLNHTLAENFGDLARLQTELNLVDQLLATEPNCKWAHLTAAVLVLALDKSGVDMSERKSNLVQIFHRTCELDPMRKGYFNHVIQSLQ